MPQDEDKRFQIEAETFQVQPSKSTLSSSPPFSNTQNTISNSLQASSVTDAQSKIEAIAGHYLNARRSESGWGIPCPAHEGEDPNFHIAVGDDGGLMARCHSHGCKWAEIMDALGLWRRGNGRYHIAS